tara:strand:- start:25420 stop:25560 length:141 start_codon:yes stop_codon:yes gene_type:complete
MGYIIYIIDKMEEWFKLGLIKTILVLIIILIKNMKIKTLIMHFQLQ